MHYDVATKRLMELSGAAILRELAGMDVQALTSLQELPQEQTALLRCDYAASYTSSAGEEGIVIVEFQTRWDEDKLLDLAAYTALRMRRHRLPVKPVMLLFQPHSAARNTWSQGALSLNFHLVKVWEMEASALLATDNPWLWAISPLTHDGVALAPKVDTMLQEAELTKAERNDLITIFAIYLSLADKDLYLELFKKRRDLMIDSPFYSMVWSEGLEKGLEQGLERGREEGLEKGLAEGLRWTLVDNLEAMGGTLPVGLAERINAQTDVATLRTWTRLMRSCQTVAEFEANLDV